MNLNKVFLIGRLTNDVMLRVTSSGQPVGSFSIATNRVWLDRSGQRQEETEFHNIVVWGKQAELCNQYLLKGRMVMIEGRLRTRSYQTSTGEKRVRTEIIAERVQFGPRSVSEQERFGSDSQADIRFKESADTSGELGLETVEIEDAQKELSEDLPPEIGSGVFGDENPPF